MNFDAIFRSSPTLTNNAETIFTFIPLTTHFNLAKGT